MQLIFQLSDKNSVSETENILQKKYPEDVQLINKDGREFIIVGTAHISRQSADLVREVIENEKPDVVCVELDEKRLLALSEKNRWENLDLKKHNETEAIKHTYH